MVLFIIRVVVLGLLTIAGFYLVNQQDYFTFAFAETAGAGAGFLIGLALLFFEKKLKHLRIARIIWSIAGLLAGILVARVLMVFIHVFPQIAPLYASVFLFLALILGYSGLIIGYIHYEVFSFASISRSMKGGKQEKNFKILDTSVIIDGRIADICETGFIDGTLIIPQFILKELQHIADSSDMLKRNRGRRGLDILQKIQKLADVDVEIIETDFPKIREVDAKLVELGKTISGKILTNDFNLNKVAELQGVHVLNVNELANALKPVVLPGEVMNVHVLKEGKEPGQGVAYLDDGTMVVVDNAINAIGKNVEVSVTSVLQTTAGRMIFSKLKEILSK